MHLLVMLGMLGQLGNVDAAEFVQLIAGLHAEIDDVTFVVEGGSEPVDPRDALVGDTTFQALYSYRSDGATLLDCFMRQNQQDGPGWRTIQALRGSTLEIASETPDLGYSEPVTEYGAPGVMNGPGSPERILFLWLPDSLENLAERGYQFLGWEKIDGHRCLKVQFYQTTVSNLASWKKGTEPVVRLWIDIERGGHPLRAEYLHGKEPRIIVDQVELREVPFNETRRIWFPMRGRVRTPGDPTVLNDRGRPRSPDCFETYAVVDGSLRFNQALPDSYFTARRKGAKFDNDQMRRLQQELTAARRPPFRTDPEGVQERLDHQLAEAEKQSTMLDASAPSAWWHRWMPWTLGGFGVGVVAGALVWRRIS